MKNVFIDSNIWLSLYAFSSDDLNQFMKLGDLINKDIRILLPEQVRDEVYRNRENKIKDAMMKFENWKLEIPNIGKGYDNYNDFQEKIDILLAKHREFIQKIKSDIVNKELHADKAISNIFSQCSVLERTPQLINESYLRYNMGNPPGKDHKFGDAINWLSLLMYAPDEDDLFFIGADGDFQSVLDKNKFNQFLIDEWKMRKHSEIFFFKTLTEFFNTHLQAIQLKNELMAEQEKDSLISSLENSLSFAQTHNIIAEMTKYSMWSNEQACRIFSAAESNSQVWLIKKDEDVFEFLASLPKTAQIPPG